MARQRHLRLIVFIALISGSALLAFNPLAFPQQRSPFKPNLSFKLTGGWGSALEENDVNRMLDSFTNNSKFVYLREHDPSAVIGELTALDNRVSEWEAEVRMDFSRHISLGVATSLPYKKTNEGTVRYIIFVPEGQQVHDYTYHPTILVGPPIKFTLYYCPFKGSMFRPYFNAGIGLYPVEIRIERKFFITFLSAATGLTIMETNAQPEYPLGFHAGFGLELDIAKGLSLVVEGQVRGVNFANFRGRTQVSTWEWTAMGDLRKTSYHVSAGGLYYYTQEDAHLGARYAWLHAWDVAPTVGSGFPADVRRAKLNLSRSAIRVGLRIRLF